MKFDIPFIKPDFPAPSLLAEDIKSIVSSNWYTNFGPYEQRFRAEIKRYLETPNIHVVTVCNATAGIDIAVRALFLGNNKRREVLVPAFTFAAGPAALISLGLTPVFIDIDEDTWQPSYIAAEKYLKQHYQSVAGILLGNTFGVGTPDIDAWEELASKYSLPLIVDSAAGFGSKYHSGEHVGTRGTCEVFSFHATKPFAVGEGGAIVTRDASLAQALIELENFGFNDRKEIVSIGTNAKLDEISSAIGLRQLENFDERLIIRRARLALLKTLVDDNVVFQRNDENSSVPFMSVLFTDSSTADEKLASLTGLGIMARKYYAPLHKQRNIMKYSKTTGSLACTEDIYSRIVALPLHDSMSAETIGKIAELL